MTPRATIGGDVRHLGAWKPSRLQLRAVKPAVDVAALPLRCLVTNAGKPYPTDYDQGQLGSCGPNSMAEYYEFKLGQKFSRLFLYYFTRATEGDIDEDGGVEIPDLVAVAQTMGMPPESDWDYDINAFRTAPPLPVFAEAHKHRVGPADLVADLDHLLAELAANQPVMFGFQVPASMEDGAGDTATTGIVRVPSATDPAIGGHCVSAIGFDRELELVRCTCHYGSAFGDHGTIFLPFAHWRAGNVMDMRAIRSVS